jgi:hypothetical protein
MAPRRMLLQPRGATARVTGQPVPMSCGLMSGRRSRSWYRPMGRRWRTSGSPSKLPPSAGGGRWWRPNRMPGSAAPRPTTSARIRCCSEGCCAPPLRCADVSGRSTGWAEAQRGMHDVPLERCAKQRKRCRRRRNAGQRTLRLALAWLQNSSAFPRPRRCTRVLGLGEQTSNSVASRAVGTGGRRRPRYSFPNGRTEQPTHGPVLKSLAAHPVIGQSYPFCAVQHALLTAF